VYFEQMVYPDEVHDFLLHKNWLEIYAAAFNFFERKMTGARADATGDKPEKATQP
jgi:dipeptidyl aminopeptidase/acylaminoacyl peptidase